MIGPKLTYERNCCYEVRDTWIMKEALLILEIRLYFGLKIQHKGFINYDATITPLVAPWFRVVCHTAIRAHSIAFYNWGAKKLDLPIMIPFIVV